MSVDIAPPACHCDRPGDEDDEVNQMADLGREREHQTASEDQCKGDCTYGQDTSAP